MSSSRWQLDQQYADLMKNHPFGIALYRPPPQSAFKPGVCGYFDGFGEWNSIAQLDDPDSLNSMGLSPVREELQKAPRENIKWGPKTAEFVKVKKISLSAGIDSALATALPVNLSAAYAYSTETANGAVLLTAPPVVHERYYFESHFKKWVKENAKILMQKRPEVKDYGFWIVTSTFATKLCEINMWKTGGKGVKVGFAAKAVGIGEAGPSGEWKHNGKEDGWNGFGNLEGDEQFVVFFGGLKFQFSWFIGESLKPATGSSSRILRGVEPESDSGIEPEVITTIPAPEEETVGDPAFYLVDCEEYLEKVDFGQNIQAADEW